MQYIVLDMEWNQPWPGSPSSKIKLPSPIRGEIIQLGAVRLLEDQTVADEFSCLVAPKYYKKLTRKISSLTGIRDAMLKQSGIPFPEAMEQFRAWCGEDCVFLTWGFDDITILKENLTLHGLPSDWADRWYNAQMIFNAQTDGSSAQKALKTALEIMGIEPSRPAHDALGDAYHTALICSRLRLQEGMDAYNSALKTHEEGFHGADLPGCIDRKVFHGFASKDAVFEAMGGKQNLCPQCGAAMSCGKWISQPNHRYMTSAVCPEHGSCLVRIRIMPDEDETWKVSRLTYEADSEAAKSYAVQAQKSRRRRRHSPARTKQIQKPQHE